jgi:histone H3/H4
MSDDDSDSSSDVIVFTAPEEVFATSLAPPPQSRMAADIVTDFPTATYDQLMRDAGINEYAPECRRQLRELMVQRMETILRRALLVCQARNGICLVDDDIVGALRLVGEQVIKSETR